MYHALIVLALIVLGLPFGKIAMIGLAAMGIGIFVGREHAQAEYRWIEKYGDGKRANMPWYGGFVPSVWNLGSALDVLLPILAALVVLL